MRPVISFGNAVLVPRMNFLLLAGLFFSWLSGCASPSNLANMWRDPSFTSSPMQNIFIIALKKDATNRRLWEDAFVSELGKYGVTATPSYRIFPHAMPDTAQVVEAVRRDGYEGVLIARRLGTQTSTNYVPGYTATEPITRYNPWTNMYYTYYRQVHRPGYTETEKVARHEVNLWTTKEGGRMVWAGDGEILDPTSAQAVRAEITKLIVPELARQGLIPAKQK